MGLNGGREISAWGDEVGVVLTATTPAKTATSTATGGRGGEHFVGKQIPQAIVAGDGDGDGGFDGGEVLDDEGVVVVFEEGDLGGAVDADVGRSRVRMPRMRLRAEGGML